jgi:nickel-dependent lactate racemase
MDGPAGNATRVRLELRSYTTELALPTGTDILRPEEPEPLADVSAKVDIALATPIGAPPLAELCRAALARAAAGGLGGPAGAAARKPSVVVVISDHTRTVPYRGDDGILWPLVRALVSAGIRGGSITVLVATGTHRRLAEDEIWALIDDRVREAGVRVSCHDAADPALLTFAGRTSAGDEVFVNRTYAEADLRILTGLVEPHGMAGVSGGRKSICPGLVDVRSVRGFHGPKTLADPRVDVLVLEGNPCHQVALEVARMAPPHFILNVTARQDGRAAGVFAGDMEQAHAAAVQHLRSFIEIPLELEYDLVVTHAGRGGVNYYQAQKAADVAARAARPGGYVVVAADTTESDPVGTASYRRLLRLFAHMGPDAFVRAIQSDGWEFVHDQWAVQMWARVLEKIPADHLYYYSPQTAESDYPLLPNADPRCLGVSPAAPTPGERVARFVHAAVDRVCRESRQVLGREPRVAYLADGPHGIPLRYPGTEERPFKEEKGCRPST